MPLIMLLENTNDREKCSQHNVEERKRLQKKNVQNNLTFHFLKIVYTGEKVQKYNKIVTNYFIYKCFC